MVKRITPGDALERAIEIVGSAAELGRRLKVPKTTVSTWRKRGGCSPKKAVAVEHLTGGKVTRYQLCPAVFGEPPTDYALSMRPEKPSIEELAQRAVASKNAHRRRP